MKKPCVPFAVEVARRLRALALVERTLSHDAEAYKIDLLVQVIEDEEKAKTERAVVAVPATLIERILDSMEDDAHWRQKGLHNELAPLVNRPLIEE
jgi:hypothetical protein